jgi:hypothetical protein
MVFDFGCYPSANLLSQVLPAARGAVACIFVVAGLAVIGRTLRKKAEFESADVLCGWGVVVAFMTTVSVLHAQPLEAARFLVFGAMLLAAIPAVKHKYFISPFWLLVIVPGLGILVAINIVGVGTWDDFSHWVPNALYLWQNDGVPGEALPVSNSFWPGYPYAVPFLTYLASHLAGGFLVEGAAMMNWLILLVFAAMLAEARHPPLPEQRISLISVGWLSFALLAVTYLNPSFNASFTMTNQGDTSTMVAVGALGLMFWKLIDALVRKDREAKQGLILQIILVSTLLVLIKQSNIALLGLLIISFMIVGWKNKVIKEASLTVLLVFIVAFLFRYLWEYHVNTELSGNGKGFKPIHEWRWDLVDPLLRAMGDEALQKIGCFGLILIAAAYGLVSVFRPTDRVSNFGMLAGLVSSGYIVFLTICYLGGAFNEGEAREAASFYRYATHVGLLNVGLVWIALPSILAWVQQRLKTYTLAGWGSAKAGFCLFAVLALPVVLLLLHPTSLVALPSSTKVCSLRNEARSIAARLPKDVRLAIIESVTNGKFTHIVRFQLSLGEAGGSVVARVVRPKPDAVSSRIKKYQQDKNIDAIYVQNRLPMQTDGAAPILLLREEGRWKQLPP